MKNAKSGFTLLEVVLVVAIATLLFMSVVMGIGGRIATGRYETATNEIVDYFRDVYAATLNTENNRTGTEGQRDYCTLYSAGIYSNPGSDSGNLDEQLLYLSNDKDFINDRGEIIKEDAYPGRTDCAIYGKAIYFSRGNTAHIFDVVGNVVTNVKKEENNYITDLKRLEKATVLQQLEYARADIFAAIPYSSEDICKLSAAGSYTTYEPNWGTLFKSANSTNKGDNFVGMVMIVRSPLSGNVSTFFYENKDSESDWGFLNNLDEEVGCGQYSAPGETPNVEESSPVQLLLKQEEDSSNAPKNTGFCIGSDDFYVAFSGAKKYVEFIPGGQNATAVKLNESSIKDENEKGYNPCL